MASEREYWTEYTFEVDIPKLQTGGLHVPFFAAYTSGYYNNTPRSISRTLALINALYWTEKNNPDTFQISSTYKEIMKAVRDNNIAAVPTIEGAYSMDKNNAIELLRQYDDLGIKAIGFTWNYSNDLGEGANREYNDPTKRLRRRTNRTRVGRCPGNEPLRDVD